MSARSAAETVGLLMCAASIGVTNLDVEQLLPRAVHVPLRTTVCLNWLDAIATSEHTPPPTRAREASSDRSLSTPPATIAATSST
jgi:hypothetical protein